MSSYVETVIIGAGQAGLALHEAALDHFDGAQLPPQMLGKSEPEHLRQILSQAPHYGRVSSQPVRAEGEDV